LVITKPALAYLKKEFYEEEKITLHFFVRYGGIGAVDGFSVGMNVEESSIESLMVYEDDEIALYITPESKWYFEEHEIALKFSRKRNEIEFEIK
jgi:uncharacterized protein YneR